MVSLKLIDSLLVEVKRSITGVKNPAKGRLGNALVWFLLSLVLALIINAFFSDVLSSHIPFFDKIPPVIVDVHPLPNQVIYNLTNVSVSIKDQGMGVDFSGSTILLEGHKEGNVSGKLSNDGNKLYFVPEKLKPDIYTLIINPKDKAGNNLQSPYSTVFYFSKEPEIDFWIRLSDMQYFPGDPVGGLVWNKSYRFYLFLLNNNASSIQSIDEFSVHVNLPYPVLSIGTPINLQAAQTCKIKYPEGREIILSNKKVIAPSCDLILECSKLPSGGTFSGQIIVDTAYAGSPVWSVWGLGAECANVSTYTGSYFWDEFGYTKKTELSGEI